SGSPESPRAPSPNLTGGVSSRPARELPGARTVQGFDSFRPAPFQSADPRLARRARCAYRVRGPAPGPARRRRLDRQYSSGDLAFGDAARRWLARNVPGGEPATLEERRAWHRRLYEAGYVGMGWPVAYGGRGATPLNQAIVADEMARSNAPPPINPLGISI